MLLVIVCKHHGATVYLQYDIVMLCTQSLLCLCREDAFNRVERSEGNYFNLPPHHRCMLPAQPQYFHSLKDAIRINYQFIRKIVESAAGMFVNSGISCMVSNTEGGIHTGLYIILVQWYYYMYNL